MRWRAAACPVGDGPREWIERSTAWLAGEFGPAMPLREPVLPTAEQFPGPYSGTPAEIRRLVGRICGFTGVHPELVTVEIEPDDGEAAMVAELGLTSRSRFAAGHYRRREGQVVIGIDQRMAARPVALVATIAHELGHVRLLDEGRISAAREDHEPLTDLFTVFAGLGVFTANSAFTTTRDHRQRSWQRLGYLSEQQFGYGLACYAWLRGEQRPGWDRHLTTNPRAYLRQGLRYLRRHGAGPELTAARGLLRSE
ncbi:hypothetical protein OG455_30650 [Kitasatospora sp. NBC_01287]|uniref:hypothetical protein n=1 Tax=Kitasatospora sp. NBC_01287 TaxID=2903573 RepID=UPI002252FB67|nr:hypothetical protein [Kitasatospora sp. NBC_01287]MCX4749825.1 hypothetical protein [Kitasatospora sp. NBC_01287]